MSRIAHPLAGFAVLAAIAGSAPAGAASNPPVPNATGVPVSVTEGGRQRVVFSDGRTLDVHSVRIHEGRATLRTEEGHVIAFAADRILKIESLPYLPAAPEALPLPPSTDAIVEEASPTASGQEAKASPLEASDASDDGGLEAIIREAAARYDLEVDLLAAVIAVESGYRPDAVSPKGAQGLMQLMPATAKELAVVDPFNPRDNVFAGARYLRELLDKNGDQYWRALAAYNAGSGRVARYDGLPPYKETIAYIRKVIALYAKPQPIPSEPTAGR